MRPLRAALLADVGKRIAAPYKQTYPSHSQRWLHQIYPREEPA